jgi:MarR family transcriptional regulator, 2-MHQ and catechol-resistance regulon repressor
MHQFEISSEGRAREASVHIAVLRLTELFPEIDAAALEANLMLARTYTALVDMRAPYWSRFGITGPRFSVLRLLYLAESRRLSMSEIATELNKGMTNVTQLIDGLVRDGLVERVGAPEDKRVIYARLTAAGDELFASVFPQNAQRIHEAWAPLSDTEKHLLVHLLARVRMHLLAGGAEPAEQSPSLVAKRGKHVP